MLTGHSSEREALDLHTHFRGAQILVGGDLGKIRCGHSHLLGKALGSPALTGLDKCFEFHSLSLVSAKPLCQAFASSVETKQTGGMEIVEIRRERLKKWFEKSALPEAEKSYLSQLLNGKASFGEKAARRLEKTYEMPTMYLDTPIGLPVVDTSQSTMSAKRRELIERVAQPDISDAQIDALLGVINTYQTTQPPKRPATAVSGGPPKALAAPKKQRAVGQKK